MLCCKVQPRSSLHLANLWVLHLYEPLSKDIVTAAKHDSVCELGGRDQLEMSRSIDYRMHSRTNSAGLVSISLNDSSHTAAIDLTNRTPLESLDRLTRLCHPTCCSRTNPLARPFVPYFS